MSASPSTLSALPWPYHCGCAFASVAGQLRGESVGRWRAGARRRRGGAAAMPPPLPTHGRCVNQVDAAANGLADERVGLCLPACVAVAAANGRYTEGELRHHARAKLAVGHLAHCSLVVEPRHVRGGQRPGDVGGGGGSHCCEKRAGHRLRITRNLRSLCYYFQVGDGGARRALGEEGEEGRTRVAVVAL